MLSLDQIRTILLERRTRLTYLGVSELWVFGSYARQEQQAASDIDVLARFSSPPTYDRYMDLKFFLESCLGARIDLVTEPALRSELRPRILSEAIRVA